MQQVPAVSEFDDAGEARRIVAGDVPLAEAVENIKTGTRQFAKRQHTWFRNLAEIRSVPIVGSESAKEMADKLMSLSAS